MNEEGNRKYLELQNELRRKILEGDEARRQSELLQQQYQHIQQMALAGPSTYATRAPQILPITATIQEVTSPSPSSARASSTSSSTPIQQLAQASSSFQHPLPTVQNPRNVSIIPRTSQQHTQTVSKIQPHSFLPGPHLQQQSYVQSTSYVQHNLPQTVSSQSRHTIPQGQARHNPNLPGPPQGAPPSIPQQQTNGLKPQFTKSTNPYSHIAQFYNEFTRRAPSINGSQAQPLQNVSATSSLAGASGQTGSAINTSTAPNGQRMHGPSASSSTSRAPQPNDSLGFTPNASIKPMISPNGIQGPPNNSVPANSEDMVKLAKYVFQASYGSLSSSDILHWAHYGRRNSDVDIPTTRQKLFKGLDGLITLLAPTFTGKYAPVNLDTLPDLAPDPIFAPVPYRLPPLVLYRDEQGNYQFFGGPLTTQQAQRWFPVQHVLQQQQPSKPKRQRKTKPKQDQVLPKLVPAQADKTRLAKDILRTLGSQVGEKRPREDATLDSELSRDGGPKRQAMTTGDREPNGPSPEAMMQDPLTAPVVHPTAPQPVLPAPVPPKKPAEPEPVRTEIQRPVQIVLDSPPPTAVVVVPGSSKSSLIPTPHFLRPASMLGFSTSIPQSPITSCQRLTFAPKPSRVAPKPSPAPIQQSSQPKITTAKPNAREENGNRQDILMTSPSPSLPPPIPTNSLAGPSRSPLFLPSPSSSPSGNSIPDFGDEPIRTGTDSEKRAKQYGKRSNQVVKTGMQSTNRRTAFSQGKDRVIVLMPSPPEWVRKDLERMRRGKARDTRDVIVVNKARTRTDRVRATGSEGFRISRERSESDDAERLAVQEAYSRIHEHPCKWKDCDAVLNSTDNLMLHLPGHVPNGDVLNGFYCLWHHCGQKFSDREKLLYHLDNHARRPIFCAYEDCEESFRHPRQLVEHNLQEHKGKHSLRPTPKPFKPNLPPLPPTPESLPSYMSVPRRVVKARISEERHQELGPWVLMNITGTAKMGAHINKKHRPVRGARRLANSEAQGPNSRLHEYDFLEHTSSKPVKMPNMLELTSCEVSQLVNEGLVLWPDANGGGRSEYSQSNSDGEDAYYSEHQSGLSEATIADDAGMFEPKKEMEESIGLPISHGVPQEVTSDEEAVAFMLRDST